MTHLRFIYPTMRSIFSNNIGLRKRKSKEQIIKQVIVRSARVPQEGLSVHVLQGCAKNLNEKHRAIDCDKIGHATSFDSIDTHENAILNMSASESKIDAPDFSMHFFSEARATLQDFIRIDR